ncbi:MAG: type II secretion system protein GspG [Planctomycetaceae bacterium]|jgi:hypothetical protein|nr:type II secretion system protein GspG [Planctomycetaceae bacterium]
MKIAIIVLCTVCLLFPTGCRGKKRSVIEYFGATVIPTDFDTKKELTLSNWKLVSACINSHYIQYGKLPSNLDEVSFNGYSNEVKKSYLLDHWGNSIVYEILNDTSYRLWSFGADGKRNGTGDNTDFFMEYSIYPNDRQTR